MLLTHVPDTSRYGRVALEPPDHITAFEEKAEGAPTVVIAERDGRERELPVTTLVDHPGAVLDVGELFPGRRGRAVPIRLLMSTDLSYVTVEAERDGYRASIPTVDVIGGGYLLVGTPERPLAADEGGPVRLLVRQGSTLCWNVKSVTSLRASAHEEPDSVPESPPH